MLTITRGDAPEKIKNALTDATLPASLYECMQIGHRAFLKAHTGMSKITLKSKGIAPTVRSRFR